MGDPPPFLTHHTHNCTHNRNHNRAPLNLLMQATMAAVPVPWLAAPRGRSRQAMRPCKTRSWAQVSGWVRVWVGGCVRGWVRACVGGCGWVGVEGGEGGGRGMGNATSAGEGQ
jgi:hypothetical protein